jgi:hypothetical protein
MPIAKVELSATAQGGSRETTISFVANIDIPSSDALPGIVGAVRAAMIALCEIAAPPATACAAGRENQVGHADQPPPRPR